ncbi:site-specific integrase [Colwellia demingiae]|uniref:Site-specific integrase n=1 Tax=Colwellia demingiae TaxID=89401 RepID=A0A5C6QEM8_9GAMM|nr:site-specific integrase [Colwellia demingiae]TWX67153.1 site-specific integrase [Colwellia demingiae]
MKVTQLKFQDIKFPNINDLSSEILFVTNDKVSAADDSPKICEFEFNSEKLNMSDLWLSNFKTLFIQKCGGVDVNTRQITCNINTAKAYHSNLRRIFIWASMNKPDTPMRNWTEEDCQKLILSTLQNQIDFYIEGSIAQRNCENIEILGHGPVESLYSLLLDSRKLYLKGMIYDGINVTLPKTFLMSTVEPILKDHGIVPHEWREGNGWDSLPIVNAMLNLGHAIEVIRSEETKLAVAFFKHQQSVNSISHLQLFNNGFFEEFCASPFITPNGRKRKVGVVKAYTALKKLFESILGYEVVGMPFNYEELVQTIRRIYGAALTIFLSLTGIRISEVSSIYADDYKQESDGVWVFKSDLVKTNYGLTEVRTMSGLVAEAANIMVEVSYTQKVRRDDGIRPPLFAQMHQSRFKTTKKFTCASENTLRSILSNHYSLSIEKYGSQFANVCNHLHPHMLRHSFAEFAIRRFDGNVLEAIRQHFRHAYGSKFTKRYTDNKLTEEVSEEIERDYIDELVKRMAFDDIDDAFVGHLALFIKRKVKDVAVIEPSEVEELLKEVSESIESIEVHEYGICIVIKETKGLSKCLDKETQSPNIENGCFKLCSGCLHNVSSKNSNKEEITRIVISHQEFLKEFPIKTRAHSVSKEVVKNGTKILDEWEQDDRS